MLPDPTRYFCALCRNDHFNVNFSPPVPTYSYQVRCTRLTFSSGSSTSKQAISAMASLMSASFCSCMENRDAVVRTGGMTEGAKEMYI